MTNDEIELIIKQLALSHQTIIEMIQYQEERIDKHDDLFKQTDERINLLIDSNIRLGDKIDALTADVNSLTADVKSLTININALTTDLTAVNGRLKITEQNINRLIESQAKTDQQIKSLADLK
jgi:hypothetical protein